MATRDKRIDAYIAKSADFAQPILSYLRDVIHAGCPEIQETIKWSFPNFEYKGILVRHGGIQATLLFWILERQPDP